MNDNIDPIYVCIDTNQYIKCSYNFMNGKLKNLKLYCNQGLTRLILTDVIAEEVKYHIKEDIKQFHESRKNELKKARVLAALREDTSFKYLFEEIDVNKLFATIDQQFEEYINDKNVVVINNDMIDLNSVLSQYFSIEPPFESTKKRNEFKDAFIINALVNYSKLKSISIHIISADEGFKKAFKNNPCFIIHEELSDFFKYMNDKCHKEIYDKLESYLELPTIKSYIENATEEYFDKCTMRLYDDEYGTYTNSMIDSFDYEKESYIKMYYEERDDDSIIAHMELRCLAVVIYDISDKYFGMSINDEIDFVEKRNVYSIVKNFQIEFGLSETEGGLYIEDISFDNDYIEMSVRNLLETSVT